MALVLAAAGLYGVLAFSVSQRFRDIGIRVALGAHSRDILRQVLGEGLTLTVLGLGLGLVLAVPTARLMASLLFQVKTTDPVTYLVSAVLLAIVALAACGSPALRAARTDPLDDESYEVVGGVRDGTYRTVGEAPRPMVLGARAQRYASTGSLVVRTAPGRAGIARELAQIARSMDPHLPAQTNAPYTQVIGVSLLPNRAATGTAAAFGFLGLLLASVGLYGVLSYAVSLRWREIGIRMALGADGAAVRRMVMRDGLRLVGLGLLVGLPLALGAGLAVRSLLLGLGPADPVTFAAVAALLVGVGLLASYMPARRATTADPMGVLRCE